MPYLTGPCLLGNSHHQRPSKTFCFFSLLLSVFSCSCRWFISPYFCRLNVPGPGNYDVHTGTKHTVESAPAYTFGLRARGRKSDAAPAPNNYSLPQIVGQKHIAVNSAPQYTLTGRSKVGGFDEDLKKVSFSPKTATFNSTDSSLLVFSSSY